jgi:hypothetical protein
MENMKATLLAQGIDPMLVDSILKSFRPPKEKKAKANAFFSSGPKKVEKDVLVVTRCMCCGDIKKETITMKVLPNSPLVQKLAVSVCPLCPEFLAQLTKEELITLVIFNEKPNPELHHMQLKFRIMLAKKTTPSDAINFTSTTEV